MSKMDCAYDSLSPLPKQKPALQARLSNLGANLMAANVLEGAAVSKPQTTELMGASPQGIKLQRTGAVASVALDAAVNRKVSASLTAAASATTLEAASPDRDYVDLENVRGTFDASVLSVYINLPQDATPADHPELLAGSVGLFGLRSASQPDGKHGGEGLNFNLEITDIVDRLHLNNALDVAALQVRVVPHQSLPEQADITIGRISVYREGENGVHNKGFIVDSKVVALGSQNWSSDGVLRNRDASVIIANETAAKYYEQIFLHDWNNIAKQSMAS